MRPRVIDKIFLVLVLLSMIAIALGLVCVAIKIVPQETLQSVCAMPYGGTVAMLVTGGAGIVILVVALRLFIGYFSQPAERTPKSALVSSTEFGATYITLDALDAMVQRHCRANAKVRECTSAIRVVEDGVTIKLRISAVNDTNVVELTDALQRSLKEYIETLSGIKVTDIGILIVCAPSAPKSV